MTPRQVSQQTSSLRCALCQKPVRSVYAQPGETNVRLCAACFFRGVPTTAAKTGEQK